MGMNLNGVNQCTISYRASKDLILVHTVQLNPMIKAQSPGRMVSSGIRGELTFFFFPVVLEEKKS